MSYLLPMRLKLIAQVMGFDDMDGILLLDKPKGMTSHDCVNRVRKLFNTRKVGHAGTLDPDATGVLVLAINRATKILQFLENDAKVYEAEIAIGKSTTTEDASGDIVYEDLSHKSFSRKDIEDVLQQFLGKQTQIPPMVSAVKIKGKKLYEYARNNVLIDRPKRNIEVFELVLLDEQDEFSGIEFTFNVRAHVSKGTYIRTLAKDIGESLGYPAHLKALRRIQSGRFSINECVTFDDIERGDYRLVSIKDALRAYQTIVVGEKLKQKIIHGQKLIHKTNDPILVFVDQQDHVLAVYGEDPKDQTKIKPLRVLWTEKERR